MFLVETKAISSQMLHQDGVCMFTKKLSLFLCLYLILSLILSLSVYVSI